MIAPIATGQTSIASSDEIQLEQLEDRIVVWTIPDDSKTRKKFTEYRFSGFAKPILYPVLATGDVAITRHHPMDQSHKDEANDHPHHKSIWFAHGDVNGIDFWSEKASIKNRSTAIVDSRRIVSVNDWMAGKKKICSDETTMEFVSSGNTRRIDFGVKLTADDSDVVFGDTKEGTFAIRTHPALRITGKDKKPAGRAFNSKGIEGKSIWGKKAKWVCYVGDIDGQRYSVAVFDHPGNLRHPTTWHAREYGLVAANPFGLHHFTSARKGTGQFRLLPGESFSLKYGVLIFKGELTTNTVESEFQMFSADE